MDEQMNQGPSMENQPTPSPSSGKNGSNALTIVVIIIILVIAAFLLWRYLPASDDTTVEPTDTDTSVVDDGTTGDVEGAAVDTGDDMMMDDGANMEAE